MLALKTINILGVGCQVIYKIKFPVYFLDY